MKAPETILLHGYSFDDEPCKNWTTEPLKNGLRGHAIQYEKYIKKNSFPSNLYEAAEEYAYTNWESDDYHEGAGEGLPFDAIGYAAKCFKAGAEWMAGQGETIEGEILTTSDYGWENIRIPKKLYPLGTKVTIQIRKKQ